MSHILAIDQGTSSTKSILFDGNGKPAARGVEALKTNYFGNGFVEQDPDEIQQNVVASLKKCLEEFKAKGGELNSIKSCGISNQRETFILWDKAGKPVSKAIVWQCKRSIEICHRLKNQGLEETVKSKTGLVIDPYFSGTKLIWLWENDESAKKLIACGEAHFGTVDTWLLYRFTGGESYYTDYTNASRTLFFNLHKLDWDRELLETFGLGKLLLPEIKPSSAIFGETDFCGLLPSRVPITAMIGDSHAAAFGEGCFSPGTAKATLGTGCSILMNVGSQPVQSSHGMMSTICWSTSEQVQYALEGVIVSCGATIEWLKNELGLFDDSNQTEALAQSVADNGGVYLVPAFSGMGAPYWNMESRASITGLSFGTGKNHVVRAALESIPYQIKDVVVAMEADAKVSLKQLMVDGGISSNRFVIQFLSDLLTKPVIQIGQPDVSALGAAYLSGLHSGVFQSVDQITELNQDKNTILPSPTALTAKCYEGWKKNISKFLQNTAS